MRKISQKEHIKKKKNLKWRKIPNVIKPNTQRKEGKVKKLGNEDNSDRHAPATRNLIAKRSCHSYILGQQ